MNEPVAAHYTRGNLQDSVLAAIVEAGFDPDNLQPEVLAPMEEFHTFGAAATTALAEAAGITSTDHVLDVGSGLGGPARHLAGQYGCRVTGIDLTAELTDVAIDLTGRVGLSNLVDLHQGDALAMPFDDGTFDVAWTQHVSMNIADKAGLYAEMRRVTRTGGRLAFFDILAGEAHPIHFPVPWAEEPGVSHLATSDETRSAIEGAGFSIRTWSDLTSEAVAFYRTLAAPSSPSPLGLHLLIPNMPAKGANLAKNVTEGRIRLVRCVAEAL